MGDRAALRCLLTAALLLGALGCAGAEPAAATASPAATAAPAAAELEVVARLVETPKNLVACGEAHVAAVMRYELVSVQRGAHQGPLFVIFDCPLNGSTGIKEFRPGDTLRLQLTAAKRPTGNLTDPFGEPQVPRLFAVHAEVLPPAAQPPQRSP